MAKHANLVVEVMDLLKSQPPASDLDAVDAFFRNVHALAARVIGRHSELKVIFSQSQVRIMNDVGHSRAVTKCTSAATLMSYVGGTMPERFEEMEALADLYQLMLQVMKDCQTLVSSYRAEYGLSNLELRQR